MYSYLSSTQMQNFVMVTLAVAMTTLKNLSFFGKNGHFQPRWEKFWARKTGVAPLIAASHADSKSFSRFSVSLTVFEIFGSEDRVPGTPEFSRYYWRSKTAAARILKFGMVIELIKTNSLYNYAKALSRIPWVPEGKNCFSAKNTIFQLNRPWGHITFLDRSTKFGMVIHLNEYYISLH